MKHHNYYAELGVSKNTFNSEFLMEFVIVIAIAPLHVYFHMMVVYQV